MRLSLYQPDIPQNVGSMIRLAACFGAPLDIIEPCGFVFDEKRMKRVAMDYADVAHITRHDSWEAFCKQFKNPLSLEEGRVRESSRIILLTTKASDSVYDFTFKSDDILLLGRESAGVPPEVAAACDVRLRIPISSATRSLNLVQAASVAMGEAMRQNRIV